MAWVAGNVPQVTDIGDEVTDFNLDSQMGQISFRDYIDGKWAVVVTFGKAFEPVSTTEIGMLGKLHDEFEARNITTLCIGTDNSSSYRRWIKDIEELNTTKINFPLLSDPDCRVLKQFGCARDVIGGTKQDATINCFATFIIDLDKKVRYVMKYSTLTGRNFYEILRAYDAIQISIHYRVVIPTNWGMGQDVLVHPDMSNEEAASMRFATIKPYFRLAPCPEVEK